MNEEKLNIVEHEERVKDVVMLAAKILLESGAEGTRTEDTMDYISEHYGFHNNNSFVTNTVINFILHDQSYPRIYRVKNRTFNLTKVSKVNTVSRKLVRDELTLDEAYKELTEISVAKISHSIWFKTLAGAIIALSFLYLQTGGSANIIAAIIAGALGVFISVLIKKKITAKFIPEFFGGLAIALTGLIGQQLIQGGDLTAIIIAGVIPIVPGVLITNAVQDLIGGHMLMFVTKALEAVVTSFAIGAGVSSVLIFL